MNEKDNMNLKFISTSKLYFICKINLKLFSKLEKKTIFK